MGSVRARNDNGLLFFDFRTGGKRCREQTTLPDTKKNRSDMERVLAKIEKEIAAGTFLYRRYFPNSKRAALFDGVATVIPDFDAPVTTSSAPALRVATIVTPTFEC